MRVLVCGGRDYDDKYKLDRVLNDLCEIRGLKGPKDEFGNWMPAGLTIIHGGAKGADSLAEDWAIVNWVQFERYPADWKKFGKGAGHIRNKQMLDTGIDLVVAFPGGRGTANMVDIAKKAGVEVWEAD